MVEALPDTKSVSKRTNDYKAPCKSVRRWLIQHTVGEMKWCSIRNWKQEYSQLPKRRVYLTGVIQCTVSGEIWVSYTGWRKKNACFSNNCNFVYFQYKKITLTPKQPVINAVLISYIDYSITESYRVAQKEPFAFRRCPLAPTLTRFICLRLLSLGLPQIKSLRSKTSYSRSESFNSRRNCNCATRNVSKCDAELWGEAPAVCTARRTPSFRYNFP